MTPLKRPLASAGAAVLLGLALTACGGGAPSDASVDEFCEVVTGTADDEAFSKAVADEDWDKLADLIKEQADNVEEVGTPEDIPDDAREGYEIQLDAAKDVDPDDIEKAFKEGGEGEDPFTADLDKDEKKKLEAYTSYQAKTCSGADAPDTDEVEPSDLSTDDLPTDVPSDLPTSPEDLESLLSDLPTNPEDFESLLSDLPTQ